MNKCDKVKCGSGKWKEKNNEGIWYCLKGYKIERGRCVEIDEWLEDKCHSTEIWKN
jgi:hypothetical protein